MKAIIQTKYGSTDVLKLKEVEKPEPKENEVQVEIYATSLNAYDWRHLGPDPFMLRFMGGGLFKPKHPVLGADISGTVVKAGANVKLFKTGDEIFSECSYGGLAEFVCIDENRCALKPAGISFDEAAASPMAAITALQGLRDHGEIQAGQKVLINGASGGVGSYAVQFAKYFGTEVTAVCSTSKIDMVHSLGADHIIDYKTEDITQYKQQFDLIYDIAAFRPVSEYKKIMKPSGIYVVAGGSVKHILGVTLTSKKGVKAMKMMTAKISREDLNFIGELLSTGKIKSIIDKSFPLENTREAILYLKNGNAKGKVIISIIDNKK